MYECVCMCVCASVSVYGYVWICMSMYACAYIYVWLMFKMIFSEHKWHRYIHTHIYTQKVTSTTISYLNTVHFQTISIIMTNITATLSAVLCCAALLSAVILLECSFLGLSMWFGFVSSDYFQNIIDIENYVFIVTYLLYNVICCGGFLKILFEWRTGRLVVTGRSSFDFSVFLVTIIMYAYTFTHNSYIYSYSC